ncbi:MAG: glycerophosphodiester phosphodiesterase family protein [Eubacteriales bacterium]|nr:glycerophosphodiester phosphodiesterase family protein [Eubacteriales bacterium]
MITKVKYAGRQRFVDLLRFEIVFRLLAVAIGLPLLSFCTNLIGMISGRLYLSPADLGSMIRLPLFWVGMVILIPLTGLFILLEIVIALMIFYRPDDTIGYRIRHLTIHAVRAVRRCFTRGNRMMLLLAVYLGMFTFFPSAFMNKLTMPGFIRDTIFQNPWLTAGYYILKFILFLFTLALIFSAHVFFMHKTDCRTAVRESIRLVRGRFIRLCVAVLLAFGLLGALNWILSDVFIELSRMALIHPPAGFKIEVLLFGLLRTGLSLLSFGRLVLSVTVLRYVVSVSFARAGGVPEKPWHDCPERPVGGSAKRSRRIVIAALAAILVFNVLYVKAELKLNAPYSVLNRTKITAHRACGESGPENTLEGLVIGAARNADYAEIDVRLTADGELILLHDKTFRRVADDSGRPEEMTLADIRRLHIRHEGPEIVRVPTLREAIETARKVGLRLNIEVKTTEAERNRCTDRLIEILDETGAASDCVVTASDYAVLARLREKRPAVKTGYILVFARGDLDNLDAADFVSVEEKNVDKAFANRMHAAGKGVHVWTVNERESMDRMLDLGVDNIITDQPGMAALQRIIYEQTDPRLRRILR